MSPSTKSIAILVPDLPAGGGVSTVVEFLYDVINASDRYQASLISLAVSRSDPNSVRLFAPATWQAGVRVSEGHWRSKPFLSVGAFLTEFEFQRYRPRHTLTTLLEPFDLIQVVSGSPANASVVGNIRKPVCLFLATLARLERQPVLQAASLPRRLYGHAMLPIVSSLERWALGRADHVFAESEYTWRAIQHCVTASKTSLDTVGVDTQRFRPIPEAQRRDDYILSVGRFADARKNVGLLFEAYALLRQQLPEAPRLVLAGRNPPPPAAWARAKALGIIEHVEMQEEVTFDQLVTLYQHAAFFVLSSDEEGLGIVLLEALACATPVISTRCGGPDSVVTEDVGFLTPVGDAEALAERMAWMVQHPEQRRQMGQAGRQMVEKRFSNIVVGQKYLDVYDQLLGI